MRPAGGSAGNAPLRQSRRREERCKARRQGNRGPTSQKGIGVRSSSHSHSRPFYELAFMVESTFLRTLLSCLDFTLAHFIQCANIFVLRENLGNAAIHDVGAVAECRTVSQS